jgi:hypothetical protein
MAEPSISYSPVSQPTIPSARTRLWPGIVTLLFLSPIIAELLSGSTPPLMFINPVLLLLQTTFYGSAAILIREVARRKGLGWGNIVLMGMAYGILEEGLVITSWFNPYWSGLGKLAYYGRLFDTSWVWATELTIYHAVISITIPILLTDILYPTIAKRPWLKKRSIRGFTIALTLSSLVQFLLFGFLFSRKQGYTHPPLMYFGALVLALSFIWLGLHFKPRQLLAQPSVDSRPTPGLWKVRLSGLATTFAFFITAWILPSLIPWPILTILVFGGIAMFSTIIVNRWARRSGWSTQHQLALITGVISFFLLLAPLDEFVLHSPGRNEAGLTLVNFIFLCGLSWLAWSMKKRGSEKKSKAV